MVAAQHHHDGKLKRALELYMEEWLESFPNDGELAEITFSPKFENRMDKLISAEKKPYWRLTNTAGKRIACAFAAVIIMFTVTVCSVQAIREPFFNFIVETYEKFSSVIFGRDEGDGSIVAEDFEVILPSYLPDGFTAGTPKESISRYFLEYKREDGKIVIFEQMLAENTQTNINTENITTENVSINGYTGLYYENKGFRNIVFSNGPYGFMLTSDLDREELTRVAESIPIRK